MRFQWETVWVVLALVVAPLSAATVDGTRVGDNYGAPLVIQTVETGFGDNASEWNAAYSEISAGKLFLMFTGNLEANFNKLEIFIDSVDGNGRTNTLNSIGNDGAGVMNGMMLDTAFAPDYHMIVRRGGDTPNGTFDVDFALLNDSGGAGGSLIVDGNAGGDGRDIFEGDTDGDETDGIGTAGSIMVGYDNSNMAGIGGTAGMMADQAAAAAVETGLELGIDLADIGSPSGPVKVMLLQNNQGHDFLSNQTLAGLPVDSGNLGGNPSGLDFNNFAGDQFFVVPEPSALLLLVGVFGVAAWVCRVRQKA